jgi:hypothetical protein
VIAVAAPAAKTPARAAPTGLSASRELTAVAAGGLGSGAWGILGRLSPVFAVEEQWGQLTRNRLTNQSARAGTGVDGRAGKPSRKAIGRSGAG